MIRFFPSDHACFYPIEKTLDFISSADFPYFFWNFICMLLWDQCVHECWMYVRMCSGAMCGWNQLVDLCACVFMCKYVCIDFPCQYTCVME